ncbi:MAG TPA: toxin-antitoxin system HicB family antitoxin [Actinopolymorphaceae bacterium]
MLMHMELSPYVDSIRRDLAAAAEVAGPDARAAAERLTAALDAAVRLALLDALSEASSEITRELAPGSVELRLRAREPEFVVTPPPAPEADESSVPVPPTPPVPPPPPGEGEQGMARITLRMPESLKARVEEAAAAEGISVNAWLVRAINAAVAGPGSPPGPGFPPAPPFGPGRPGPRTKRGPFGMGTHVSGWVR